MKWEHFTTEDWRAYCEMRRDERADPFLKEGERAHASSSDAPPSGGTAWRELPPTVKQIYALKRMKAFDAAVHTTRGACSDAISRLKERGAWNTEDDNDAWRGFDQPRDWGDL